MATTPVCTIDTTGLHVPVYADCLTYFQSVYQGIYGSDISIEADDQDGQFLAILALALNDANTMTAAVYNAFSPATAQGTGLSSVVKVNGITRKVPTYSTNDIKVVGVFGTTITGGQVSDGTNTWSLPTFTIPSSGVITVTATCTTPGAITCPAETINTAADSGSILNPTYGWQSAQNLTDATPGAPLETDAALRIRQSKSTMLPSLTILDGIVGALLALSGVTAVTPYENDTSVIDANGLPGHTIAMVVTGGDATEIAQTIALKKGISGTYGTTAVIVTDTYGISRTIRFFRPTQVPITGNFALTTRSNFTAGTQSAIAAAFVAYVNGLGEGQTLGRFRAAAASSAVTGSSTFLLENLTLARNGRTLAAADLVPAFNEQFVSDPSYLTFTLTAAS